MIKTPLKAVPMQKRFEERTIRLNELIKSNINVILNPEFNQLIEEENMDLKRNDIEDWIYYVKPSLVYSLSKAIAVNKGFIKADTVDFNEVFKEEFGHEDVHTDYSIRLMKWVVQSLINEDKRKLKEARRNVLTITLILSCGLSSRDLDGKSIEEAQELFDNQFRDYLRKKEAYDLNSILLMMIVNAFLSYEEGDSLKFRYCIMKAQQINSDQFPFQQIVELLAAEMI